jgi:hypothetical protein
MKSGHPMHTNVVVDSLRSSLTNITNMTTKNTTFKKRDREKIQVVNEVEIIEEETRQESIYSLLILFL